MSAIVQLLFYVLTFFITLKRVDRVIYIDYSNFVFSKGAFFLNYLPFTQELVFLIYVILLLILLKCVFNPTVFYRAAGAVCFLIFESILNAHTPSKPLMIWSVLLCIMVFYDSSEKKNEKRNAICIDLIQSLLLINYFVAGLWKLRIFFFSGHHHFKDSILEFISVAVATGLGPGYAVQKYIFLNLDLLVAGFILIILSQLTILIPIFKISLRKYWGWMGLFFHLMTGLLLGVQFYEYSIAVFLFLIFIPYLKDNPNFLNGLSLSKKDLTT